MRLRAALAAAAGGALVLAAGLAGTANAETVCSHDLRVLAQPRDGLTLLEKYKDEFKGLSGASFNIDYLNENDRRAKSRAAGLARTLKPTITAPVALARITSLSLIPPTPECSTRMATSSVESLLSELLIASTTTPRITTSPILIPAGRRSRPLRIRSTSRR